MKRLLLTAFILFSAQAWAVDLITATLTFTNGSASGNTLVVSSGSAVTRTFTNATSATTITTNGTAGGTATNAFLALAQYPTHAALSLAYISTNSFSLKAPSGSPLTVTLSASVGAVTYSTQQVANQYAVRVPVASEPTAAIRTNVGTGILDALAYSTNAAAQTITALSGYVSKDQAQTISNKTLRTSTLYSPVISGGEFTNASRISGTLGRTTNGTNYSGWFTMPTTTGLTNYGSLQSIGDTTLAMQYGYYSTAWADKSLAIGHQAYAWGASDLAIGDTAKSDGTFGIAIGSSALNNGPYSISIGVSSTTASNSNTSIAIGFGANTSGADYQIALGSGATVAHGDAVAIGSEATSTEANQIMLGSANSPKAVAYDSLRVGGNLAIGESIVAFPTSLAKGLYMTNGTAASADPVNGFAMWSASGVPQYRTSATSEGAGGTMRLHNRAAEVVGSGANYSLTTSSARVDFGGTDPEFNTLPTAGTYLIMAYVGFTDGATVDDQFYFKFYDATAAADIANSEVHLEGDGGSHHMQCVVQSIVTVTGANRIQLYGRNATAARGTVESIHTKLIYVRLY